MTAAIIVLCAIALSGTAFFAGMQIGNAVTLKQLAKQICDNLSEEELDQYMTLMVTLDKRISAKRGIEPLKLD